MRLYWITKSKKVDPPLIATVGNIGLQRLLGNRYSITNVHGQPIRSAIQQLNAEKMVIRGLTNNT